MTAAGAPKFPLLPHLRRIAGGLLTDYGTSTVILVVNFVSVPVYLRYLSAGQFGIWLALTGFLSVVSLADPGLSVYVTKRLAEESLFSDRSEANRFLSAAQTFQTSLVAILALVGGTLLLAGVRPAAHAGLQPGLIAICAASALLDIAAALNGAIITARMRFADVYMVGMLRVVLAFAFSVAMLRAGLRIEALAYGTLFGGVVANAALYIRRRMQFPGLAIGLAGYRQVAPYLRAGKGFVWSFQVLRITQLARVGFLPILFAAAAGPAALAKFNITARIPQIIPQYVSKLAVQFFPYLSSMGGSPEREARTLFTVFNAVVIRLCLFSAVAVLALDYPFVSRWVGSEYFTDVAMVLLIVATMIRECFFGCAGVFLYANANFSGLPLACAADLLVSIGVASLAAKLGSEHAVVAASAVGSLLSLAFVYKAILAHQGEGAAHFAGTQLRIAARYSLLPTAATALAAVALRMVLNVESWAALAGVFGALLFANVLARELPLLILSRKSTARGRLLDALVFFDLRDGTAFAHGAAK